MEVETSFNIKYPKTEVY